MMKQYEISFDDCEYIFQQLEHFISNGLSIAYKYDNPIKNLDMLQVEIMNCDNSKMKMLNNMLNNGFDWDFNCRYENNEIRNEMMYPWGINFSYMLRSYFTKRFDRADLERYFINLDNNLPELKIKMQQRYIQYHGTDKWIESAKSWTENVKHILSNALRKISVSEVKTAEGGAGHSYYAVTFFFTEKIQYQQKRKIVDVLNEKLLPRYNSTNSTNCKSLYQCQNISYDFNDNGRKCNTADSITFKLQSNMWNALGMCEEAQFVPKMGMKKHFSI